MSGEPRRSTGLNSKSHLKNHLHTDRTYKGDSDWMTLTDSYITRLHVVKNERWCFFTSQHDRAAMINMYIYGKVQWTHATNIQRP